MKIKGIAFGIARDIVGGSEFELTIQDGTTVADFKQALCVKYPAFEALKSFAIAIGEEYREDDYPLNEHQEVVIIPPVSGG